MLKKLFLLVLLVVLSVGSTGCSKKKAPPLRPGQLTVEEKAKLKLNAIKAYEQILKNHRDSPHAAGAEQRLKVLQPNGPPKK